MTERYTRRGVLAAGAALTVGAAGCLGSPPGPEPSSLSTEQQPILGEQEAPVTVTIFEDYACPHCGRFSRNHLPNIESEHVSSGNARIFHVDFPIPVDQQWSFAIANAAQAVFTEAGHDAFWQFSKEMFANQGNYSTNLVEQVGNQVANVGSAAKQAANNRTYSNAINNDRDLGNTWGVSATPTVYVGTEQVEARDRTVNEAIAQQL